MRKVSIMSILGLTILTVHVFDFFSGSDNSKRGLACTARTVQMRLSVKQAGIEIAAVSLLSAAWKYDAVHLRELNCLNIWQPSELLWMNRNKVVLLPQSVPASFEEIFNN